MPTFESAALSFRWELTGDRCQLDLRLTECLISESRSPGSQRCSIAATGTVSADIGISHLQRVSRRGATLHGSLCIKVEGEDVWVVGAFRIGMQQISRDGSLWSISLSDASARFHDPHLIEAA